VSSNAFPYFVCDATTAEYCDALRRYGPVTYFGIGTANGWTAGKAFELAAEHVPDDGVTSQDILEGLWTFKDQTLGGLTHPLTFTSGQTVPRRTCWWPLVVEGGSFTAPDGVKVRCAN
jgi:branched-chain amino acid transport system substrate-binding protein